MLKAKTKTGLVFFPAFDWAIDPTHPEREERLLYTQDQVFEEGILDIDGIVEFKPDLVTKKDVQRVHFCVPDLWAVMTESHFISAGGAKTIAMAVMEKQVKRGFALVRPPGHHANRVVHGARGFCNVNIEAIMIEYIRQAYGVNKVAIVDTDCHHGDGTQDIYWHDPDTLFISIHQDGRTLYPGSGFLNERGGPNAIGTTVNIPLPPNTSEEGILYAVNEVVLPILDEFQPEIVINSAGQDNHYSDPITNMNFSAQGYAQLTTLLKPDIAVLEGGYAIEGALPYVNAGIILAMAGMDYSHLMEPDYNPVRMRQRSEVTDHVTAVCSEVMKNWHDRKQLGELARKDKKLETRNRNIYYDTDNISESQQETIRICHDCGGALKILSSAQRQRVLAVHIPKNACRKCREQGNQWYEEAKPSRYNKVYLQDRYTDQMVEKKDDGASRLKRRSERIHLTGKPATMVRTSMRHYRQTTIRPNLEQRAKILQIIREFFISRSFLEIETPVRIPAPAPEAHIDAQASDNWYLHPSPELCMKRLLSAGYEKTFQICRCFRKGERGDRHVPEMTLLEWYVAGWDYVALMKQCEELIYFVANRLNSNRWLNYGGRVVDLKPSWDRLTVSDAFDRYGSMSAIAALKKGCFDEVMGLEIEPNLGFERPLFLTDYPARCGSLARLKPENPRVAERFELYIAGMELCNGFSELNDPEEQKERFVMENQARKAAGKCVYPVANRFLNALEDMPDAAGNAMGLDRLVMLFAGAASIDEVIAFTPEEL